MAASGQRLETLTSYKIIGKPSDQRRTQSQREGFPCPYRIQPIQFI